MQVRVLPPLQNKSKIMKYFLDTEFIEGWKKPISWLPAIGNFNKKYHSIQLISVGIVAEDGREYYAVSNEFNHRDASDWVKENVLLPIYQEMVYGDNRNLFNTDDFHKYYGKSNDKIAEEIKNFTHHWNDLDSLLIPTSNKPINVEFYAYYADYDWVVFCSLFGTMMDLPKRFPMYCKDLKQMLDEKVSNFCADEIRSTSFESALERIKIHKDYPQQDNEHNALGDAKWNQRLFDFIKKL